MTTVIHDTRTSFRPVISYMERKVSNGSGILLGKNLYEENPALYYYIDMVEQYN